MTPLPPHSMTATDAAQLWQRVLSDIKLSVSTPIYKTWFATTTLVDIDDERALIGCPNPYALRQLEGRHRKQVHDSLSRLTGQAYDLQFIVIDEKKEETVAETPLFDELPSGTQEASSFAGDTEAPAAYSSPLNPHYTFDEFVVGNSNRVAHAAAQAVADNPGRNYNPFFIWGGTGVGKTHLVQAIGNALLAKKPGTKVLYCSIERFMNDFIDSIRFKTTNEFKKRYRSVDVLIVDDIQFIVGKESTQEEFFHTYNELHASGHQIILCSDRPPREIATLTDRLVSRFEGGLTVDIAAPDFETRSAIIRTKADQFHLSLTPDAADYVASLPTENIRSLEGIMLKLQSYALSTRETLTLPVVQSILGQPQAAPTQRRINPDEVLKLICETYNVTLKDVCGKKRTQMLVTPRQMAMYILRNDLSLNLETIGHLLGGRDHTTIMHGIDKVSKLATSDPDTRAALTSLRQAFLK